MITTFSSRWQREDGRGRRRAGSCANCYDLPIDLFEALSILTLQQRERQSFSAVPSGGAILHQSLTSDVKLLQFEQDLASGWAGLQFQQWAPSG